MAQWMNVSECARLYGRSRKWVDNRIKKHNISTEKSADGNEKRLQMVDFIAHCGEPESNGTPTGTAPNNGSEQSSTVKNSEKEQVRTPSLASDSTAMETALLKQENAFLKQRIAQLEVLDAERVRLLSIIERQTLALPKPNQRGIVQRVMGWWQGPAKNL